jgi:hypothetical protein
MLRVCLLAKKYRIVMQLLGSWDRAVGIASAYGLGGRRLEFEFR